MDNLPKYLDKLGISIGIPMRFNRLQPNIFGVPLAKAEPFRYGGVVGAVREGGSCNFENYMLNVHCNGTHIECVGHLTQERISILECLVSYIHQALLISVSPIAANETHENYQPILMPTDKVITQALLEAKIDSVCNCKALIIRTLPNDLTKLTCDYQTFIPAFFTHEAMKFIVRCGFEHLIVDLPSVDRLYDQGQLSNHRIFWQMELGSTQIDSQTRVNATITEFAFIADTVSDGKYTVILAPAPFDADAAPIMPILYQF